MPYFSNCPACKARFQILPKQIGHKVKCHKCGKVFRLAELPNVSTPEKAAGKPVASAPVAEKKKRNLAETVFVWCLAIFLTAAVLALPAFFIVGMLAVASSDSANRLPDRVEARLMAQEYVKSSLKSPSSARFSNVFQTAVKELPDSIFEVGGWVDSQNSFGAMLRSRYYCKVQAFKPDDDSERWRWRLLGLRIE